MSPTERHDERLREVEVRGVVTEPEANGEVELDPAALGEEFGAPPEGEALPVPRPGPGRGPLAPLLRLYRGQTSFDFVGRRRWWFLLSGLVILAGVVSFSVRGFNFGIDFRGGSSWQISAPGVSQAKVTIALVAFFVAGGVYISLRFEPKMALAAFVALVHDLLVTAGVYSLFGFQVTPDTVVAILTILGYSLYDTVVVFDRVRDNTKGLGASGRMTYSEMVNLSMNQTLARSVNTSLVAIMPVLAVLVIGAEVLGAVTLQNYGVALLVGLLSGAYSSIFIASPILAILKEREQRYVQIRQRLAARADRVGVLTPAAAAALVGQAPACCDRGRPARRRGGPSRRRSQRCPAPARHRPPGRVPPVPSALLPGRARAPSEVAASGAEGANPLFGRCPRHPGQLSVG